MKKAVDDYPCNKEKALFKRLLLLQVNIECEEI